jgi:hypothetical protein
VLCYKPESDGLESRRDPGFVFCFFFNLRNPSSRAMDLELTEPLIDIRNLSGGRGKARLVRKADNLTAICEPICLQNVRSSTYHNLTGLHGLEQGNFTCLELGVQR